MGRATYKVICGVYPVDIGWWWCFSVYIRLLLLFWSKSIAINTEDDDDDDIDPTLFPLSTEDEVVIARCIPFFCS